MTQREWLEFEMMLVNAANLFRLPAIHAWPDWMTPEKRIEMANHFEEIARDIERVNK